MHKGSAWKQSIEHQIGRPRLPPPLALPGTSSQSHWRAVLPSWPLLIILVFVFELPKARIPHGWRKFVKPHNNWWTCLAGKVDIAGSGTVGFSRDVLPSLHGFSFEVRNPYELGVWQFVHSCPPSKTKGHCHQVQREFSFPHYDGR